MRYAQENLNVSQSEIEKAIAELRKINIDQSILSITPDSKNLE